MLGKDGAYGLLANALEPLAIYPKEWHASPFGRHKIQFHGDPTAVSWRVVFDGGETEHFLYPRLVTELKVKQFEK